MAGLIGTVTTGKDGLWPASKAFYDGFTQLKIATIPQGCATCFLVYGMNSYSRNFLLYLSLNISPQGEIYTICKKIVDDISLNAMKIGYKKDGDKYVLYLSRTDLLMGIICLCKHDIVTLDYKKTGYPSDCISILIE